MLTHILILPDGTQICSGGSGAAVMQVKLTRSVNQGQQLTPGAACAAMLEATLLTPPPIAAGDALTLYALDTGGNRHLEGIFLAEKPEWTGSRTLRLTAYDRLTLLDRDLTDWLAGLTQWPYPLETFASMVCDACGLTLIPGELPNGAYPVEQFTAPGVTGRQLMMWVGQIACRFCRATPQGDVELAWYTPSAVGAGPSAVPMAQAAYDEGALSLTVRDATVTDGVTLDAPSLTLTDDGQGNATLTLQGLYRQYCFQGGIALADYAVAPIEKVQLRQDEEDVGTVFPADDPAEKNTFRITGNPLLTAHSGQALQTVAQTLYQLLRDVTYTPGTLKLPAGQPITPGSILQVADASGREVCFYVMTAERSGQTETLTCEGLPLQDSTTAFNDVRYAPLSGKVLRLRTDVDGIRAENAEAAGRLSRLELNLEGIRGQVQSQQSDADTLRTQLTALEQTAGSISATVRDITEKGASKVVNEFGLTVDGSCVQIRRGGSDMANRLDEKGMSIVRGAGTGNETTMLRADAAGVLATDVTVRNYLVIGDHARFEDYTDGADQKRTACYWTGG